MLLTLIRGLPGSGKSTYAKSLGCLVVEADMFFMRGGHYQFEHEQRSSAHQWCQSMALQIMGQGIDIAVANTFVECHELSPYLAMADQFGYDVNIVCMKNKFKDVHQVPAEVLAGMQQRWEHCVGESIVS